MMFFYTENNCKMYNILVRSHAILLNVFGRCYSAHIQTNSNADTNNVNKNSSQTKSIPNAHRTFKMPAQSSTVIIHQFQYKTAT